MNRRDNKNEGIGVFTIVILVVLGAVGLYFFLSHSPAHFNGKDNSTVVPVEAPAPVKE